MPLQPIAEGVWALDGEFHTPLFTGSVRMIVLGGADGLVLYSPVALTGPDRVAIEALGPVAAIVAPNLYHHKFLVPALEAFPSARVFVPEGLQGKVGPIPRAEIMTADHPPRLPAGIEHFIFSRHAVHETLLFHRASRTLVTADMIYNYQAEHRAGEKRFFRLLRCYGAPGVVFYHRFALPDKSAARQLAAQVRAWAPRRIAMCHGRIVEDRDAAEIFAQAWQRLVRQQL